MKNSFSPLILIILLMFFFQCDSTNNPRSEVPLKEYLVQSVLWQQNAAEYRALAYQSYLLARHQLNAILAEKKTSDGKLAVVTDIDETVLDNSAFDAKLIESDLPFSNERWLQWGELCIADTVPGALAFFKYAASKNVEIFYISNRSVEQLQATIKNLKKFGFPQADKTHVLLKEETSDKEPRRQQVLRTHTITLLLGDNLTDFSSLFNKQSSVRRNALVDSLRSAFGTRFIVFPNPMYGDWETQGIYEGRYDWTKSQMDSLRHSKLNAY